MNPTPVSRNLPEWESSYDGVLTIGDIEFDCAVLEDETRVVSEAKFMEAMGMYRSGALSTRREHDDDGARTPLHLAYKNLKPFADKHLNGVHASPLKYRTKKGGIGHGIRAEMLPKVCEIWLDARNAGRTSTWRITTSAGLTRRWRGKRQRLVVAEKAR